MTSATLHLSLDQVSTGQAVNAPVNASVSSVVVGDVGDRAMLDNPAVESDRSLVSAAPAPELNKLPYDKAHQLELLHLRAEAEALLQQLQIEKQRKLVSAGS
ncbi:hypothetical protein O77CONTIG1_00178 [Leptolyngbya sp. O-77]|nr:hypothetical protein O77CONTIG1_00178 [Leptolyngbya sp. O-77]